MNGAGFSDEPDELLSVHFFLLRDAPADTIRPRPNPLFMLAFYSLNAEDDLDAVRQHGLSPERETARCPHNSLDAANRAASGPILVVDATALGDRSASGDGSGRRASVPAAAIQNLNPYRPPTSVTAAGGLVGCPLPSDVALLLIYRRGVWDLPKGHRDSGESLEACARREVREEIGIEDLSVLQSLATTQHGYPDGDVYAVKTTHWYLMRSTERSFAPDRREGIRRAAWARWAVARAHLGYENLTRLLDRVEADVRATLS